MATEASQSDSAETPERSMPPVVNNAEAINPYDVDEDGWIVAERGPIDEPNHDISEVIEDGETDNLVAAR